MRPAAQLLSGGGKCRHPTGREPEVQGRVRCGESLLHSATHMPATTGHKSGRHGTTLLAHQPIQPIQPTNPPKFSPRGRLLPNHYKIWLIETPNALRATSCARTL